VVVRASQDRSVLAGWGLRLDNLRESARLPAVFVIVAAAGIVAFRAIAGFRPLPGWAWIMFLVYPVWSLFQQLFVQSLLAGNLVRLGVRRGTVVVVTALLFGAVHLPDVPLALLCTGAGAFWTICFLRSPNLFPLALAHGWIGTLTYAWLLERDPLAFG
jgi:membrane protease YdiL (CAAX protease family)